MKQQPPTFIGGVDAPILTSTEPVDPKIVLHATEVPAAHLSALWEERGNTSMSIPVSFMLVDSKYRVLPEHELMELVKSCHVDAIPYLAEYMDCDKHSRLLWALVSAQQINTVGIVFDFGGRHSYNVAFVYDGDKNLALRYIEPQTSEEITLGSKPVYALERGLVIV